MPADLPPDDKPPTAAESPAAPPEPALAGAAAPPVPAPPPRRSLKKNILYAVSGMGFMNACQFVVIILITKFASAEVLGQYVWGLTVSTVWATFLSLQLRAAYISDTRSEFTFGTYSRLRAIGMTTTAVILGGLILWRYCTQYTALSVLVIFVGACFGKVALTSSEIYWAAFQRRERLDLVAKATVMRGIIMLGAFLVLVPACAALIWLGWISPKRLAHGTALACLVYAVGWAAVNWFYERRIVRSWPELDWSYTWPQVRRLAVHGLPLGLIMVIIAACEAVPRLVVEREGDAASLGYFSALTYVVFPFNLLVIQAGLAAANRLAVYSQTDIAAYVRLLLKLVAIAVGLGVAIFGAMLLIGQPVLNVLYKWEYAQHYGEFLVIVAAQCITLLGSIVGLATTQMRLFWSQVPVQLVILACTWIAAELTIPSNPLWGAAWTSLVRAIVQTGLYVAFILIGIGRRRRFLEGADNGPPAVPPIPG